MKKETVIKARLNYYDPMPYSKADLVSCARVGNEFAVSFYQLDYNLVAQSMENDSEQESGIETQPILVSRIVMSKKAFSDLRDKLTQILGDSGEE